MATPSGNRQCEGLWCAYTRPYIHTGRAYVEHLPSPSNLNKRLEPLATVDDQGGLVWMPSMLAHIKVLGLEPEQDGMRGNPPRSRATLRPIACQAEHKEEQGNDHSHTPPMISDGHRYCVGLTRIITMERSCSNKVVLSSTLIGGEQVMPLLVRHTCPSLIATAHMIMS